MICITVIHKQYFSAYPDCIHLTKKTLCSFYSADFYVTKCAVSFEQKTELTGFFFHLTSDVPIGKSEIPDNKSKYAEYSKNIVLIFKCFMKPSICYLIYSFSMIIFFRSYCLLKIYLCNIQFTQDYQILEKHT